MDTTTTNDTEIIEMLQTPMDEGMQGFPAVAARMYNLAMQFEREPHLGAGRYERTGERTGYANGHKPKTLKTAAGNLRLRIPQVRASDRPFYPRSPERGTRSDRTIRMAVAEMYVKGVSTRKVQSVFEEPCDVDVTAEQVSRAMRELDGELENWRKRPIGVVKVLFADATYHKVCVNGVVVATATFIVTGVLEDGHRAVLAPGVPWQRCQMHLQQNAQAYVTKSSLKAEVAQDIRPVFNARPLDEARRILADIVEKSARTQSRLSAWMEDDIPEGLTVFAFPAAVRQFLRTNNMEENLNRQIRQRTRLRPAFPNVDSLPGLVGAICVEISDEWETNSYRYMSAIKEL